MLTASFNEDSRFELTPELVGATITQNSGIIGQSENLVPERGDIRKNTILMHLTKHLLMEKFRDAGEEPKLYLFGQLKRITQEWFDNYFSCAGGAKPSQLLYKYLAEMACNRIAAAITRSHSTNKPIKAILDSYNPQGSTRNVNFTTSKQGRWKTDPYKCHINWAITDSDWEKEFCRIAESHPKVKAYVKNQGLGFEVPYSLGGELHHYFPDFILLVNDGYGEENEENLLHLVVEIKGYRREDAKEKKSTMETYWIPGVNNLEIFGRWDFVELTDIYKMENEFNNKLIQSIQNKEIFPEKIMRKLFYNMIENI